MAAGLQENTNLLPVNGITLAACSAGIYKKERPDLALIACERGSTVAAVFTRNAFCAAPVTVAKEHLRKNVVSHLLINAGNANAGMGTTGNEAALATCKHLAKLVKCPKEAVLPFSTGVIGEPLPVDKISNALPGLLNKLSKNAWLEVNRAILTTDTVTKAISRQFTIDGKAITVTGIAKGSGMIKPDMATMLSFIGTDATIRKDILDEMLIRAVNKSFNRISVDGDTSTNDACILIATGKAGTPVIDSPDSDEAVSFFTILTEVCIFLAQAIVRDGEGATKFVTLNIQCGADSEECLKVATAIAHSPLIKTALFASDPNWGRILAAIGRSGLENFDVKKVDVFIDNVCVVKDGERNPDYSESRGKTVFSKPEITLSVNLNRGSEYIQFWTCDFSYDYVKINAEYRT